MKNKTSFSVPMVVEQHGVFIPNLVGAWNRFREIKLCTKVVGKLFPKLTLSMGSTVLLKVSKAKHSGSQSFDLVFRDQRCTRWFKGVKTSYAQRQLDGDTGDVFMFGDIDDALPLLMRIF